jgi:hypothetical protein
MNNVRHNTGVIRKLSDLANTTPEIVV